jgi:hypothetical protein
LTGWPSVFLQKGGKAIEIIGPEALVSVEPVHRLLHRAGGQPARHGTTDLLARDQAGIIKHIEMLDDRGERDRKWLRQFADGKAFTVAEPRQQRAPRRIGKRGERTIQCFILILNHQV